MFAGHFGLAAAIRPKAPEVPLWALMLSTQLLDVAFIPLFLTGVETIDDRHGSSYGDAIIHADYTHSLLGALLLSLLALWLGRRLWGRRAGWIVGGVAFSHWLLDLVVHRADMPFLPGNMGNLPLLGLGVWKYEGVAISLEIVLLAAGLVLYVRSIPKAATPRTKKAAYLSTAVLGLSLAFALVMDTTSLF